MGLNSWTTRNAARDGQVGGDVSIEDSDPVQARQQLRRSAQVQTRRDFQAFQIKIRLLEALEEQERVRPGLFGLCRVAHPPLIGIHML